MGHMATLAARDAEKEVISCGFGHGHFEIGVWYQGRKGWVWSSKPAEFAAQTFVSLSPHQT